MEQMEQYLKSISYILKMFRCVPCCSAVFQCSNVPSSKNDFYNNFFKKFLPSLDNKLSNL